MARTGEYQEGEVWLEQAGERLWRGTTALRLRRTSFAVLRYLMAHAGQVVSKDELLEAVWPETTVSDGVLMVCVNELRTALGDPAPTPRYIDLAQTDAHSIVRGLSAPERLAVLALRHPEWAI